jgi:erythromycin esterase-like protein
MHAGGDLAMAIASIAQQARSAGADAAADLVRRYAEALPPPQDEEHFGACFDRFADARLVLLGEATHGTAEFYRARAAISRRLIERHGFSIVAVEADWPDAAHIDSYVRHRAPAPTGEPVFARFPTWMWRNREVAEFADWLRRHNQDLPAGARAEFRGLDLYSMSSSSAAILAYLDRVDPEEALGARERLGCLTPWQTQPERYGRAVVRGDKRACEDELLQQLTVLLDRSLEHAQQDGEALFDAVQNARILRAAEKYYRLMYRGAAESWNLRDRHMFDTLQALLKRRGSGAKAIVWAHNSHIGNAAGTAMGWEGEFNIGELVRTAYGEEAVLIGFGTDRGEVAAASDWNGPMFVKRVLPARADSHERVFRQSGIARSLTDWRPAERGELRETLALPRLERAIGVIYRPETELTSHYFEAVLSEQFDAFVWFEETRAVTPLGAEAPAGAPETYPFGL